MFDKWYIDLVNEKIKGTGAKVTFFMSYPKAVMWNAIEVLTYVYTIVALISAASKPAGSIAGMFATFILIFIWSKVMQSNQYYMMNLTFTPPEKKSEFQRLLDSLENNDD